jgi:hypothetical protein
MKYTRFEDLPVWQAAQDLADRVFESHGKPGFQGAVFVAGAARAHGTFAFEQWRRRIRAGQQQWVVHAHAVCWKG